MTNTPEQDAEVAHREIAALQRRFAAEYDAHEATKRELCVLKGASQGTIRHQRVTIAALKRDRARMRSEWASIEVTHWGMIGGIKEWESRTGLDMDEVLKGAYGKPWGIYSHEITDD